MFSLYLITIFFVIYSSIVLGSILKFKENGIGLNMKYKVLISIFPLFIFFLHARSAFREYKHDKKKALRIMTVLFTRYPVLLAALIELVLENMAECEVFGSSKMLRKVEKREPKKSFIPNLTFPTVNLDEILGFFKGRDSYESLLLNRLI